VKLSTFDMVRVWAALTGLVLAAVYFLVLMLGHEPSQVITLLVGGIGGFELFLVGQDYLLRGREHG
jgi:hypothetical protein